MPNSFYPIRRENNRLGVGCLLLLGCLGGCGQMVDFPGDIGVAQDMAPEQDMAPDMGTPLVCPYGYQKFDGRHCLAMPTDVAFCINGSLDGGVVACSSVLPSDDYYGQDGHYPKGSFSFTPPPPDAGALPTVVDNLSSRVWTQKYTVICDQLPSADGWRWPTVLELAGLLSFADPAPDPLTPCLMHAPELEWGSPMDPKYYQIECSAQEWTAESLQLIGPLQRWYLDFNYPSVDDIGASHTLSGYGQGQTSVIFPTRCVHSDPPGTPDRFSQMVDGVYDQVTGLLWEMPVPTTMGTWVAALKYCKNKGAGWRLPNAKEAMTIFDYADPNPPIHFAAFGDKTISLDFWTSTPVRDGLNAYHIDSNGYLGWGLMGHNDNSHAALCIKEVP